MKKVSWLHTTIIMALCVSLIAPLSTQATIKQPIQNESIYDLLVDRYFNKTFKNDFEVDTRQPDAFAGGDFLGVMEKLDHIQNMGFTMISLGPVFSTSTYDGKRVLDYATLERHFGTSEDFHTLLEQAHKEELKVMVDFPIQHVSSAHAFVLEKDKATWIIHNDDGTISWDLKNEDAQKAVVDAAVAFVKQYQVDGIRLTAIDGVDSPFLNKMIDALKAQNNNLYILSNEQSDAKFDAQVSGKQEKMFRNAFKTVDPTFIPLVDHSTEEVMIQHIDSMNNRRFTADAADENMFPPTRWKMAMAALLSLPGVPMVTYGSEIAVNGNTSPETHPILDFKTDEELIEFIGDVQSLRNRSAALRTGAMEMLHNEEGLLIYKRFNKEESWIVAINNTSKTQSFDLPKEVIGDHQELQGLFQHDILRQREDGQYRLVLDRELAEFYTVNDQKGFNKGYMVALALVYILFLVFIYLVWRKGKQRKLDKSKN